MYFPGRVRTRRSTRRERVHVVLVNYARDERARDGDATLELDDLKLELDDLFELGGSDATRRSDEAVVSPSQSYFRL